ncbi:Zinc finger BED domain-containing protein 1 [Cyphomyrmex costatus]|uniref:Zinc finger BED domain-containing protein 1 n=1 Tax=Cyphomyrmex costatus TaxID=456900 RepID=A0A151ICL6_9HYME|nr:Zinc finger BED domain-containing protein 1 [Cyphomyrmex costatus]
MILKDLQPLSIVEDEGFRRLLKILAPLYTVPSRMTITSRIDEKFVALSSIVKEKLTGIDNIVLTSDIWTDKYNSKSYLCLTAHFIEGTKIESINLGVRLLEEAHNAIYLSQILKSFCHEWNIDLNKVIIMITDNAANISKAARDTFGHLPCFAHQLNLVVRDAIKLTPEFKNIVTKVKEIVTFLKRSVEAADELRALQMKTNPNGKHLKVIQESETRWNSTFYMLKRFCKLSEFISTVLFKYSDLQMLSYSDITCIEESLKILFPIESVTVEMSGKKYVTGSKIIPIVHCLNSVISRLNPCNEIAEKLKNNILDQIDTRFYGREYSNQSSIEKNYFLSVATLLDPRFKKLHFTSIMDCSKAITRVSNLLKQRNNIENQANNVNCLKTPPKSNVLSVWNFHDELAYNNTKNGSPNLHFYPKNCVNNLSSDISTELRQFLNTPVSLRETDCLEEWEKLKYVYPNVYEIARKFLLVLGTSVSSERLYSTAGNIISEKRSRLSSNRVSMLIFLNSLKTKYWEM